MAAFLCFVGAQSAKVSMGRMAVALFDEGWSSSRKMLKARLKGFEPRLICS
jgi:hypothetical protein